MATSSIWAGPPKKDQAKFTLPQNYQLPATFMPPMSVPRSYGMPSIPSDPVSTPGYGGYEMTPWWEAGASQSTPWFMQPSGRPTTRPGLNLGTTGGMGVSVPGAALPSPTVSGQPTVSGSGPYGEIPSVPNPMNSASQATSYAQQNVPNIKNVVSSMFPNLDKTIEQINSWLGGQGPTPSSVSGDVLATNQANQPASQDFIQGIEPTIPATWDIIEANLGGQVTRPEMNAITQWGQERGVGAGFGTGSPSTNTAIQAALGNTAYARQQRGVEQAQEFGGHLYGMQRPFMVTPTEEASARGDILRMGVSAAEALGRDVFNAISQFLPNQQDIQSAQYAANVAKAAPNPREAAAEAERLQEAAAFREYQRALAAMENARRNTPRPQTQPTPNIPPPRPINFTLPMGASKPPTSPLGVPKRLGEYIDPETGIPMSPGLPNTGIPERVGEGTGEAYGGGLQYDPVSGMMFDPVYGGYYDFVNDQWLDYPEQAYEDYSGDFGAGFGGEYEYYA